MRNFVRPVLCRLVVLAVALLLALPAASAAETRYVRLEGRVQWVAGNVLSLAVNEGPSVGIDLVRVPQSDYGGLVQGDWVIVRGQLSDDYRRVLGTSIQRGYPRHNDCRSKRLTSASQRGLASGEVRAAECTLAFTTRSEVSHGKR